MGRCQLLKIRGTGAGALQPCPVGTARFIVSSWTPISVVQTLAHNSTATLSVIRDYLVQKLQKQSQQIAQDELRVRRYREETTRIRQEIQELKARYWHLDRWRGPGDSLVLHRVSLNAFKDKRLYGVCLSISCLKIFYWRNSKKDRYLSHFGGYYLV